MPNSPKTGNKKARPKKLTDAQMRELFPDSPLPIELHKRNANRKKDDGIEVYQPWERDYRLMVRSINGWPLPAHLNDSECLVVLMYAYGYSELDICSAAEISYTYLEQCLADEEIRNLIRLARHERVMQLMNQAQIKLSEGYIQSIDFCMQTIANATEDTRNKLMAGKILTDCISKIADLKLAIAEERRLSMEGAKQFHDADQRDRSLSEVCDELKGLNADDLIQKYIENLEQN